MKKIAFLIALFLIPGILIPGILSSSSLKFMFPNYEDPYYRIVFLFEVKERNVFIKEVLLNGEKWDAFFVFKQGQNVKLSEPLKKGIYDFHLDYAWKSGKEYKMTLLYMHENSLEVRREEIIGQSPNQGGIPGVSEGFYRIFRAEELAGIERRGEICYLTFTAEKKKQGNSQFLIWDGDSPIEYQILDIKESFPPEKEAKKYPITQTIQIGFPIDISPFEKKMFLMLRGSGGASKDIGFSLSGEGIGKTVKGKRLSLEFHPNSGQINIIEYLKEGIRLFNEVGVIHWNPGCFIPWIAWDHSFNWNPPPSFEEKTGKHLYINSRRGPLQKIKYVNLEVKYTLESSAPYFISETRLTVEKDLGVIAIRNDEMVLYKELFDSLIYKDKRNRVIKMPLKEKTGFPDGFVHVAPDDCDWVGLLNTEKKYGFFSLRINYTNSNLNSSANWLNKPGTYFYAPSKGKYVYWVRPLLYTWSEYTTKNLLAFVPEGSSFYEKNAYILLPLENGYAEKLDTLLKKLKKPVRIY